MKGNKTAKQRTPKEKDGRRLEAVRMARRQFAPEPQS